MVEVAEEHQAAAIVHESPVGEVNRAHAAEVTVGREDPQQQAQAAVTDAKQPHAQDAGFDQHHAAHVVLRDPILAARHLAQQGLVDRRRILRGIAPLEPAQPQHDHRGHEEDAAQEAEPHDLDGQLQGVVDIQAGHQYGDADADHRSDDKVGHHDEHPGDDGRGRQVWQGEAARPGRYDAARHNRSPPGQQDRQHDHRDHQPDDVPAGRRHRRQRHAREGEAKQGEKGEDDKLAPIRQPFEPGNPGRRRLRQPGETAEQLGAQLAMNLRGRDAAIGIGVGRAGLRQRSPGRQEELAFGKDAIPIEAAIALMEDAGAQRPLFEVRRERIARKGLGDRVVGQAVAIRGTFAAAQHRPKLDAEGCFHLAQKGPGGPSKFASITKMGS